MIVAVLFPFIYIVLATISDQGIFLNMVNVKMTHRTVRCPVCSMKIAGEEAREKPIVDDDDDELF